MTKTDHKCSVEKHLRIERAGIAEYHSLSQFHYRQRSIGVFTAIYAVMDRHPVRGRSGRPAGVIVYSNPVPNLTGRNAATGGIFTGLSDRRLQLQMLNKHVRCISRVIIEPRYRGLGLAGRLVRETMPKLDVAIVESLAVMGRVNPFFVKAGMKAYCGKPLERVERLIEALGITGIDEDIFIEPAKVQQKLDGLNGAEAEFVERQIRRFLEAYGKRKSMRPGIERTRYVLSRLTDRPVYYIWFNPDKQLVSEVF